MTAPWLNSLQQRWQSLAPREQNLLRAAGALLLLALLWWVALAPALRTLRQAETEQARLLGQWEQVQRLQAEATALKGQPKAGHDEALRALETATREQLGANAQLSVVGDRATVTLRGATPDALTQWLAQTRVNARLVPTEARIVRSSEAPANGTAGWDGTLVLNLPAR